MLIARPLALSLTALVIFAQPLYARAQVPGLAEAKITVSGEGDASIAPDMAILTLTVNKIAKTAGQAMSENAKAMNAVLDFFKKQSIAEKDLRTSGFAITPQYFYFPNNDNGQAPPQLTGYQVINSLTVRLRDISRVSEILDRSVELGINQGATINFTNDNPKATLEAARREAVKDAISKARVLAEVSGVKLERIIEISDTNSQPALMGAMDFRLANANSTPISAGENNYHVTVTITFAINQ